MPHHTIYVDIETIGSDTCPPVREVPIPEVSQFQAPANYKDPEKIAKYIEEAHSKALAAHAQACQQAVLDAEQEWKDEGLISHKGRVCCIGWAVDDEDVQTVMLDDGGEGALMRRFAEELSPFTKLSSCTVMWVGFNNASFDLKWLRHRAWKYRVKTLGHYLPCDRYPKNVFDLRQAWNGADWNGKGKLEEIAKWLGLEGKTDGIDGSKVFDFWQAGRLDEIAAYCRRDVELTRELYRIIRG